MILFYDTETTGLVNFSLESAHPSQPRLVQLGMLLCANDGTELGSFYSIIKPTGWTIPENMVHGITTEMASKLGCSYSLAIELFIDWVCKADLIVGHNNKFDNAVMESQFAFIRSNFNLCGKPTFCTMLESTEIVGLRKNNRPKWPKLAEAYKFFFNEDLCDAHDAMADIRATKRIYFALKNAELKK
jgi:DNA polymerase-3 subunit epsilon